MHDKRTPPNPQRAGYVRMLIPKPNDKPDMPKTIPCPQCSSPAKRTAKTVNGAYYYCRNHGEMLVRRKK